MELHIQRLNWYELMKDKEKIKLTLKVFKLDHADMEYTVNYLLDLYSNSRRFNRHNFYWGIISGLVIAQILLYFKTK